MCLKNTAAVKQEQGDLFWQRNLTHCSRQQTPTPSFEIPAQENLLQKHKRTSGKASTTRSIDQDLY